MSVPFMSIIRGMRVERIVQFVLHPKRTVLHDRIVLYPKRTVVLHVGVMCCALETIGLKEYDD